MCGTDRNIKLCVQCKLSVLIVVHLLQRILLCKNVTDMIKYVNNFENKQTNRIGNGFLIKPKKALNLACEDVRDVLESMKRFEGVGCV